jgi:hypothetical protein
MQTFFPLIYLPKPTLIGKVCEGGSMNAFKLAEDEAGMMVSSEQAILSKRVNTAG